MLNVTAQKSAAGAKAYFAKSDYYSEGQELVGQWGGKGAVLLGLFGEVDKSAFERLCDNQHPQTGAQLTPINRDNRRVGYDFTWSAPKSVSVIHALTGDERIVQAFRESIGDTMGEMESEMQTRVRKGKQECDRMTGNFCYAEFVHLTSRPVKNVVCPQLHAHAFALNTTFDPIENKWKAGQFGKIKGDGYYWQAVQQARFANRLQEIGYEVRRTKDAFEIAGVPESVLKKYSLRTGVIDRMAEKLGITDPKIKAKLAATTREAKDNSIAYPDLVKMWDTWLTPNERQSLLEATEARRMQKPAFDNQAHVAFAAEHIFERSSVVDERRLLTLALRHGLGEVTPEGVRAEAGRLRLLKREEAGKTLVTTKAIRAEEGRILHFATSGRQSCRPLAGNEDITFTNKELDAQQRRAVELPLRCADRVMIIRGQAGTGKTTLTTEAVAQVKARGKPVVIVAPTTPAVNVLRRDGFADADTLARLLVHGNMQEQARDGFIFLDEAGLVGSKSMAGLCEVAKTLNARIVLLGDTAQLTSVERGSPLRILEDIAKVKIVEVTQIRRQRDPEYLKAVKLLAKGKAGEGFDKLDAMGRIKLTAAWDRYEPIARDYVNKLGEVRSSEREHEALIICPTNAEGEKITLAVRDELRRRGMIDKEEHEFTRLMPLHWTQAERGDAAQYGGDEIVQFHRNCKQFKAGDRVDAARLLQVPETVDAAHFVAYQRSTIKLAKNDLVRTTAKGKTKDGRHTVGNGSVYTVKGFSAAGDILLTNGWVLDKGFGHLKHAYANTDYGAQGRTVGHVLLFASRQSYPAVNKRGF